MTPYNQILQNAKDKLEASVSDVLFFIGLKQAVPRYPACCIHLGRSVEKPSTFGGGRLRLVPVIFTAMVQGLAGRESAYVQLAERTAEIEEELRRTDFLSQETSLVSTEFVGNPIFSDNNLIMQAQMTLNVEVDV